MISRIERNHRFEHEKKETSKKPIDRRVARTRKMLHQALLSLMIEKGYEATTVEDICERANIGRSTFYAHFTGKDDLRRSHLDHFRRMLLHKQREAADAAQGSARVLAFSLVMFEHAYGHMDHFRALAGSRSGGIALATIRKALSEFVRGELANTERKDSKKFPLEVAVQCIVGAYMAVLTWWLDGGAKLPPHQMDEVFQRLMTEGITPLLP